MTHILGKGLIYAALLMFGFILGIVYSNNASVNPNNVLSSSSLSEDQESQPEEDVDDSKDINSPYIGFTLKETDDNKIDMEEGENLVIYNQDVEEVRKDLIQNVDLQRDLIDKQTYSLETGHNFFSEMGLRTADAFEGMFQKFFAIVE